MIVKRLFKGIILLVCLFCIIAAIQTGAAIYFSNSETKLEPADLVVVFPGGSERIITGFDVVTEGLAPHLMVVSTTHEKLIELLRKNDVPESVDALPGGKSRSTFEDVYQTAKTIKANQLHSVIVVTSGYHLPRALFLLKVHLIISGLNIRVQGFPVKGTHKSNEYLHQYGKELVKLWGSIIEMAGYFFTGRLVLDAPIVRKTQMAFKNTLLL